MINTKTDIYALIGHPINHSFSPNIHNTWFNKKKLNCIYVSFDVSPQNLKKIVNSLKLLNIKGFNVTLPHKEKILNLVDYIDPSAKNIGSINTVKIENGKLSGYNTDYSGFLNDLKSKNINLQDKTVLIYGCGGASKAILYGVKSLNPKKVILTNRTFSKAKKLSKIFGATPVNCRDAHLFLTDADFIVNTSSCGMNKSDKLPFKPELISKSTIVYDLIYNKKTPFYKLAKKYNLKYFSGEGMLVNQAADSFKIWRDVFPNVKQAYQLLKALRGR